VRTPEPGDDLQRRLMGINESLRAAGIEVPLPDLTTGARNPVSQVACYLDDVLNSIDSMEGTLGSLRRAVEEFESDLNRGAPTY